MVDKETGEFVEGLRKYGKSKEHRPNPIVQMGMFMDYDGIPLAFRNFPGNESEQKSLQPLEEVLNHRFGMTDYVVSTDATKRPPLDDDAADVLRARSFHHEIEHFAPPKPSSKPAPYSSQGKTE